VGTFKKDGAVRKRLALASDIIHDAGAASTCVCF
jgi:hypothetical protein